jgi:PAS domain S-box-containing protein
MSISGPVVPDGDKTPIRVLVLDDCPDDAALCLRELEKAGFEVSADIVATLVDLAACVESGVYDLLLADYRLPLGTGMDALPILKGEANDIPLILVTGELGEEEAVECVKQGATDFVLKRRLSRLVPVVRRALAERRMREAERRGREAVARLAAIVEASPDAIVGCGVDGMVTSWNAGAERMYGYTSEEALGCPMSLIIPPDRRHERPVLLGKPERRQSVRYGETIRLNRDGGRIPVLVAVSPVKNAAGEILGVSEIAQDISDLKRMEDQLRGRNRQLEEQNRLVREADRAKSKFLANMSHELRSPLNSIIGFAELLHDGKLGAVSDPHKEYLGDILQSSQQLLRLVNDVLDLARVETGKIEFLPEPVVLEKLFQEVARALQAVALKKHIRIEMDVAPGIGRVVADAARLKQILYNYLSNALKFTPEGGRVAVRARPEPPDHFRLEVEDTGIGIAAEDVGRLFVEFRQLENGAAKRYEGSGLGLALTKRIVEAQGGQVGVRSAPGQGSTFHAVLPRMYQERPAVPDAGIPAAPVLDTDAAERTRMGCEPMSDAGART